MVCQLKCDDHIREAAKRKDDDRILALTSRELVAAETHFHRCCYRNYTREPKSCKPSQDKEDDQYSQAESHAFEKLFAHTRQNLFTEPDCVKLTDLSKLFIAEMENPGYSGKNVKV